MIVRLVIARGGSRLVSDYGACPQVAPLLAGCSLAGLSSLALPGTNSFVSEFLVLLGSYPREPVHDPRHVGIIFAALYILWTYQRHAEAAARRARRPRARVRRLRGSASAAAPDSMSPGVAARSPATASPTSSGREIAVLTPLVALILVLGFFPGPVLDVITPSVVSTMNEVGLPDPVGGLVK